MFGLGFTIKVGTFFLGGNCPRTIFLLSKEILLLALLFSKLLEIFTIAGLSEHL